MNLFAMQHLGIVGAGPVGLSLALLAAQRLPNFRITLWDARPLHATKADPRALALSLGSVQLLERLHAWPSELSQHLSAVIVSQHSLGCRLWREARVDLQAQTLGLPMLGAVISYGHLCEALLAQWSLISDRYPDRLQAHFGTMVSKIDSLSHAIEVHLESNASLSDLNNIHTSESHVLHANPIKGLEQVDVLVVAEGGGYSKFASALGSQEGSSPFKLDYQQTAWVGQLVLSRPHEGIAYEHFTAQGPLALLPLPTNLGCSYALVWCVPSHDDPVAALSQDSRQHLLNTLLPPGVGLLEELSSLKAFSLGLSFYSSLSQGRLVRIGNAAQTLHPVAGQGLNLGLRDAYALVEALTQFEVSQALRRVQWQRSPDRYALALTTDFLARSFRWQLPLLDSVRGLSLAALDACEPLKAMLAHKMIMGWR